MGAGAKIWLYDKDAAVWRPAYCDANGKIKVSDADPFEIVQDTPQDLKHTPHGYYAAGPSYLPLAVNADGKLLLQTAALDHLTDIGDVDVPAPTAGYAVYWDNATSLWKCKAVLSNVVEDTTPQLGGDLDCQDKKLTSLLGNLFKTATELTIATGVITVTQALHTVDTEGDVATDDLATINGGATVNMIVIKAANDGRTVVVKHNTGNIWLQGKADINLDDLEDGLLLVWSGTKWFDIAAGGAAAPTTKIQDADGDTSWDVEESADEDKIHGKVKGVEAFLLHDDGILDLVKQSSAKAYRSGTHQSIPNATTTLVELNAVAFDIQDEFSIDTHRFTAKKPGTYLFTAGLYWRAPGADNAHEIGIERNSVRISTVYNWSPSAGTRYSQQSSGIARMTAGQYLTLWAFQNTGVAEDVGKDELNTYLMVHKLS